jgi:LacI family transcriptional regulator
VTVKVTLKDVARAAGVSLATASYALNGKPEVGEGTRAHVAEIARKLGYQANLAARSMKTGRSGVIGLVIPNITNPVFAKLAQSVTSAAEDHGQAVLLVDSEGSKEAETDALHHLVRHGADGLIWFPVNDETTVTPKTFSVPVVVLDRNVAGFDLVEAEYADGGRLIAEHLLEQGHQRIGLVDGPADVENSRARSQGLRSALADKAEIVWAINHPYVPMLTSSARDLIAKKEVSAIVCGNDLIALGVMAALRALGVTPGEQIAVVGFDDIDLCELVWPPLSSIRLPIAEMGLAAVERLNARIRKPELIVQRTVLPVSLIARASSLKPDVARKQHSIDKA